MQKVFVAGCELFERIDAFLGGLFDDVVQILLVEGQVVSLGPPLDDKLDLEGDKLLDKCLGRLWQHWEPVLVDDEKTATKSPKKYVMM